MQTINTELIDDGTLDTVIRVNNKEYRFNYQDTEFDSYEVFLDWCYEDAINQYQEDI